MGLIFSWFTGSNDHQALQDVTVDTQVKIEDALVNKARSSGPLHAPRTTVSPAPRPTHSMLQNVPRTCVAPPPVPPTPQVDDTAVQARSAGITRAAPCPAVEDNASVPLDALSALSDTLGAPEPVPEPPKLDPSEIVNEGPVVTEEAELVGERESTLPPDYRFPKSGTDLPPAVEHQEPSMDPSAALDILSGDFASTPATVPAAVPKKPCLDAIDMLDGDFAAPALAEEVKPDNKPKQTPQTDGTPTLIACDFGTSANLPTDVPADLLDEAPAICDLPAGNLVPTHG